VKAENDGAQTLPQVLLRWRENWPEARLVASAVKALEKSRFRPMVPDFLHGRHQQMRVRLSLRKAA
jgi:hypothetical protein